MKRILAALGHFSKSGRAAAICGGLLLCSFAFSSPAAASLRVCNLSGDRLEIAAMVQPPINFFSNKWETLGWQDFEGCINLFSGRNFQIRAFVFFRKPGFFFGHTDLDSTDFRISEVRNRFFAPPGAILEAGRRNFCMPPDATRRPAISSGSLDAEVCLPGWTRDKATIYVDVRSQVRHAEVSVSNGQISIREF